MSHKLVGGIDVVFSLRDRKGSLYDKRAQELKHGIQPQTSLTLKAQVYFTSSGAEDHSSAGYEEHTRGYLVVLAADLESLAADGTHIRHGDRIAKVGRRARVLYVTNDPMNEAHGFGHYADAGGAAYVQINFSDHDPLGPAPAAEE